MLCFIPNLYYTLKASSPFGPECCIRMHLMFPEPNCYGSVCVGSSDLVRGKQEAALKSFAGKQEAVLKSFAG